MPAYLIADEIITDPDTFDDYKRAVLPTITAHGGRFLSRGGTVTLVEDGKGWEPGRMVIIEFPSVEAIRAWYDSPEYAAIRGIRLRSATSTLIALDSGSA